MTSFIGLKENVIIGKLIPAGTGMKRYKNIELDYGINAEIMENIRKTAREKLKRLQEKRKLPQPHRRWT